MKDIILLNCDLCHGLSLLDSNFKYNSFYNSFTTLGLLCTDYIIIYYKLLCSQTPLSRNSEGQT